jgi:hypothetical protein
MTPLSAYRRTVELSPRRAALAAAATVPRSGFVPTAFRRVRSLSFNNPLSLLRGHLRPLLIPASNVAYYAAKVKNGSFAL